MGYVKLSEIIIDLNRNPIHLVKKESTLCGQDVDDLNVVKNAGEFVYSMFPKCPFCLNKLHEMLEMLEAEKTNFN